MLIGYSCAHIPSDASKRFDNPVKQLRHANWAQLVGLLVFNSAGYDCALVVVSRIHEPKRTAPRAITLAGSSITLLYVACLTLPYLASKSSHTEWQTGYFVTVAREVGPEWLAGWVFAACILTALQSFTSALITATYTLTGMFSKMHPRRALAISMAGSLVMSLLPLGFNLGAQTVVYTVIMLLEIFCFLRLAPRDASVGPKGRWARRAVVLPAIVLSSYVIAVQARLVLFGSLTALGVATILSLPREKDEAGAATGSARRRRRTPVMRAPMRGSA